MAQWIASCRAIPARETASPESGSARPTTAGCSTAPSTCSIEAGLTPSSARTCRGTSPASSPPPSRHWSDWAAALRLEFSARPRPERATGASGSSCLPSGEWGTPLAAIQTFTPRPVHHGIQLANQVDAWSTPRASDGEKGGPNMSFGAGGTPLPTQAAHWETPSVAVTEGSRLTRGGARSDELLLTGQALAVSQAATWPTLLTADDGRKVTTRSAQTQLCNVAEAWPSQPSRPDLPTVAGGRSSPERRRLNPLFVEWLMGWPEGLSGFDTAGTASCRSPQPSPGCGCMGCWLATQRGLLSSLLTIAPPKQAALF